MSHIRDFVCNELFRSGGTMINARNAQWCKKYHPNEFDEIMSAGYDTFVDNVYTIYYDKIFYCDNCGAKMCPPRTGQEKKYCSRKCSKEAGTWKNLDIDFNAVRKKAKQTCLERYGVDNPMKVERFKEKVKYYDIAAAKEKAKQTWLERYGVDHPMKVTQIREKAKQTCLGRYGVEHPMHNASIVDKAVKARQATNLQRHLEYVQYCGVDSTEYRPIGRHGHYKSPEMVRQIYGVDDPKIETIQLNYKNWWLNAKQLGLYSKTRLQDEIAEFIESVTPIIRNTRQVIPPQEIDIFVPSHNLAIEINGVYWHNSFRIDKLYHANKTNTTQQTGIQLIHIWENDWRNKQDIVRSLILSKLGITDRIMARKCTLQKVSKTDADEFFDSNHLKGRGKPGVDYGLYYNNSLVMCMRFSRHKKYGWELLRMATRQNTTVVGGMSKILSHFSKTHSPETLMSYVDRDISNGRSYYAVGFELLSVTGPSYWYVDSKMNVVQRHRFQRHITGRNEEEYTRELRLFRIHNSGNLKMLLTF